MRIHTNSLPYTVDRCLASAQAAGLVAQDVHFVKHEVKGSRSRSHAVEVQLGTYDKTTGPTRSRHFKNTGTHGADSVWAATYDEWGHFLARVFLVDRDAIAGPYNGRDDFHAKTEDKYLTVTDEHEREYAQLGTYAGD